MITVTDQYIDDNPEVVLKAATDEPVLITVGDTRAYVMLTIQAYGQLIGADVLSALLSEYPDSEEK